MYLLFVPGLVPGTKLLKPLEFPEWLKSVVIHNKSLSPVPELTLVRWFLENPYLVSRVWLLGLNGWTFNTPPPTPKHLSGGEGAGDWVLAIALINHAYEMKLWWKLLNGKVGGSRWLVKITEGCSRRKYREALHPTSPNLAPCISSIRLFLGYILQIKTVFVRTALSWMLWVFPANYWTWGRS